MKHQRKLKKTRMLIDAVDQFIHDLEDIAHQYVIDEYKELLNELEEKEEKLERAIERKLK